MMIGSPVVASFIARWSFWILLVQGWLLGRLGARGIAIALALWLGGLIALRSVLDGLLFAPYVACLDIALVLVVFRGDVRLT